MQEVARKTVGCPHCGEKASVSLPNEGADVRVRQSVASFGEYTTVTCSRGRTYWVYFC